MPKISVIMLTYNRENFIRRAINSILNQTMCDFEFIIVDNGSTDRSGMIADEYATNDSRISVYHREKGNIGSGRNTGLEAAKGEYITFIDDDDWCKPDYLKFLYHLAIDNNASVAICGSADKVFNEKCIMSAEEALIELMWRKKYNVAFPAKLFKSALFIENRFSVTSKYDDIELMPRIMGNAIKVAYYGLPLYTFERHASNNSAWTTNYNLLNKETLEEYLSTYEKRTLWLCDKFPNSAIAWKYFKWSFMLSMVDKIETYQIKDCQNIKNQLVNNLAESRHSFLNCDYILDFEKEWLNIYI